MRERKKKWVKERKKKERVKQRERRKKEEDKKNGEVLEKTETKSTLLINIIKLKFIE